MPQRELDRITAEYNELFPDGPDHAEGLEKRVVQMWTTEPNIDPAALGSLAVPTLVMAGDRDVIALEHTALIAASIPGAQLAIVPNTSHLLVRERPELIGAIVTEFLGTVGSPAS